MTPELIIITEAIKIILRDKVTDDKVETSLLMFYVKSIEEIIKRYQTEVEMLKTWRED